MVRSNKLTRSHFSIMGSIHISHCFSGLAAMRSLSNLSHLFYWLTAMRYIYFISLLSDIGVWQLSAHVNRGDNYERNEYS